MLAAYKHEPLTDFTNAENRQAFIEALNLVKKRLGTEYPLVIGGERVTTDKKIISYNPANKNEIIGIVSKANKNSAEKAIGAALTAFETWKKWNPESRANILFKAAAIIKRRKHEFSAYMVKEAGKPWNEADADTAEAIDFLEYYGRQIVALKEGAPVQSREGEINQYRYISLGVGIVISPFNMGPVIDRAAYNRIFDYIEIGKREGRLVTGGEGDDSKGFYMSGTDSKAGGPDYLLQHMQAKTTSETL